MAQNQQNIQTPLRARCQVPLRVGDSTIPGAGRGLFVLDAVAGSDLIFSVAKPLLCIVYTAALERTCDNCFAATSETYQTVIRDDLKFKPCTGCKVLHYCSEECKAIAWEHYHKAECTTLNNIREHTHYGSVEEAHICHNVRAMVRLLCLHDARMISVPEWEEVLALKNNNDTGREDLEWQAAFIADIAAQFEVTKLTRSVIKQLVFTLFNNNLTMDHPLLQSNESYPTGNGVVATGICLEPSISIVNHSCVPNSWWTFNGSELQLRATQDIAKGAELTSSYIGITGSHFYRQNTLLKGWGISCSCSLCEKGPGRMTEEPFHQILEAHQRLADGSPDGRASVVDTQHAIDELLSAGFGLGEFPLRSLYQDIYLSHIIASSYLEAFRVMLKVYYEVDPIAAPRKLPDYRVNSLKKLVGLVHIAQLEESSHIPGDVRMALPYIYGYLREKVCKDTDKCFGPGSEIAVFEKKEYQKDFGHSREGLDDKATLEDMNLLLAWAGVRPEGELL